MIPHCLGLDHVVINTADRLDEAVDAFARLGFRLTPRGYHSTGSINHLMMFGPDYLELLGMPPGATQTRPELTGSAIGLNALALATDSAAGVHAALERAKFAPQPPLSLARPVATGEGTREARFELVRLPPQAVDWGRVFACEHLTRELVWRDGLRAHPNSAREIIRLLVVVPDPATEAARLAPLFAEASMREGADRAELTLGRLRIELVTAEALHHRYGDFAGDAAGRSAWMAGLALRCASLDALRLALRALPARDVHDQGSRVVVAARRATNTLLEFVE